MEPQKLHFMETENPMKTRAHSRMSNGPLLVTEPFLPKTFPGDVESFSCPWNSIRKKKEFGTFLTHVLPPPPP